MSSNVDGSGPTADDERAASEDEGLPAPADEERAPRVDVGETVALFATPTVGLAALFAVGGTEPLIGAIFGAILGSFLGMVRRSMYAVRTPDGITRRPRRFDDGEAGVVRRLVDAEYDPRYELLVAVVCAVVGIGSFVALVLFADDTALLRPLITLAIVGVLGCLGAIGSYALRS